MSRSGYSDDCEFLELYRANVQRSLQSKRGQEFLKELASAMDAMPEKRLITGELVDDMGDCCALGVVCESREIDSTKIDEYEPDVVGKALGISRIMAAEIAYMNDEHELRSETPEDRWKRIRKWVDEQIIQTKPD